MGMVGWCLQAGKEGGGSPKAHMRTPGSSCVQKPERHSFALESPLKTNSQRGFCLPSTAEASPRKTAGLPKNYLQTLNLSPTPLPASCFTRKGAE